MKRVLFIFLILLFASIGGGIANAMDSVPERPIGFVSDYTGILGDVQQIENDLESYQKETGNEISVVIVDSVGDGSVKSFASELFKKWGIGQKDKDNGVLIFISLGEKGVVIERGYGLESSVDDDLVGAMQEVVSENVGKGKTKEGVLLGIENTKRAISGEDDFLETKSDLSRGNNWSLLIVFILVIIFIIVASFASVSFYRERERVNKTNKDLWKG